MNIKTVTPYPMAPLLNGGWVIHPGGYLCRADTGAIFSVPSKTLSDPGFVFEIYRDVWFALGVRVHYTWIESARCFVWTVRP